MTFAVEMTPVEQPFEIFQLAHWLVVVKFKGNILRIDAPELHHDHAKEARPITPACEGFFGRLLTELFYPRDWRASTA